jgi:hypothetical protein
LQFKIQNYKQTINSLYQRGEGIEGTNSNGTMFQGENSIDR